MDTSKKMTVQNTEISVLIGKDNNDYISPYGYGESQ